MLNEAIRAAAKLYRWSEIESEEMNPLLHRQFVSGERMMLARIELKQDCVVPEHSHENEQISYVVSGALEFTLPDRTMVVRAGEILVIPSHVAHAARALEDTINLDVFAPPRKDWIDKDDAYLRGTFTAERT